MNTFTRVRSIADILRIIAIVWMLSGVCCFVPDRWVDSFLAWFGVEQMPRALPMIYVLRAAGCLCFGIGAVIWAVATDIVRYRLIVITIVAVHLIAAPAFYLMDAMIGLPRGWCIMDFTCFFLGGAVPLAVSLWPAKTSANPQGGANGRQPSGSHSDRPSSAAASRRSP